jgi:hypothetical protein
MGRFIKLLGMCAVALVTCGATPSPATNAPVDQTAFPCAPGRDNRASDLCAQWKAADAAAEAAKWSGLTGIFTGVALLIGFGTLAAAVAAAIYARDAARHGSTAAEAATKSHEAFLDAEDAWLTLGFGDVMIISGTAPTYFSVATKVTNSGRAPAILHSVATADSEQVLIERPLSPMDAVTLPRFHVPKDGRSGLFEIKLVFSSTLSSRSLVTYKCCALEDTENQNKAWGLVTDQMRVRSSVSPPKLLPPSTL